MQKKKKKRCLPECNCFSLHKSSVVQREAPAAAHLLGPYCGINLRFFHWDEKASVNEGKQHFVFNLFHEHSLFAIMMRPAAALCEATGRVSLSVTVAQLTYTAIY